MSDDRPDALLTSTQRAFLSGETDTDWNAPAGRTQRTRIRERIPSGLQDFALLADPEGLSDRDAEQLQELPDDESLIPALEEMIAFIYRLQPDKFESIVEAGARRGVNRYAPDYDVRDVTITIQQRGLLLDRARAKMEEHEALTDMEIRVLLADGELPAEEIRDYVQEHPSPLSDESLYGFR